MAKGSRFPVDIFKYVVEGLDDGAVRISFVPPVPVEHAKSITFFELPVEVVEYVKTIAPGETLEARVGGKATA